jgi:hypothetical protein
MNGNGHQNGNGQRSVSERARTAGQIFQMPLILALLSSVGLASALLGDGVWDALSWLTLGVPVLAVVWFSFRPGKSS